MGLGDFKAPTDEGIWGTAALCPYAPHDRTAGSRILSGLASEPQLGSP